MKLNQAEKQERKELMQLAKESNCFIVRFGRVTFVAMPTCRKGWSVSWSVCSLGDVNKRKRGELVALNRWYYEQGLPVQTDDIWRACLAMADGIVSDQ